MITFNHDKFPVHPGYVLLWSWVAFTTLYTLISFGYPFIAAKEVNNARVAGYNQGMQVATEQAMQSFSGNAFQNGQLQGQQVVVSQLIQQLAMQFEGGCTEVVPVTIGTGTIGILSTACLEKISADTAANISE